MLPVNCHAWTCLSIVMLECTSRAKRFPPKAARISFLPNKYKKTEQHFYNEDRNKQVHSQIKMHLKNITKIEKYRKT